MPTAYENATLNLRLFELRREPVLREARDWFLWEFHPESLQEMAAMAGGERNAFFRMVLGYWDMAASLVTSGAIDPEAFLAAHGEVVATFSKVHPFLEDIRGASGEVEFCRHMERVVLGMPDAEQTLARRRKATGAAAVKRAAEREVP